MKFISWNVNGIRAAAKGGFFAFFKKEKPDILALQEIKISDTAREKEEFNFGDYSEFWNPADRPGYSGTAVFVKKSLVPLNVTKGIGVKEFDIQGRVQTLEFKNFIFINAYFPHVGHELLELPFKLRFNLAFLKHLNKLKKLNKPLIICGDLNVAHKEIDIKNAKANVKNGGFTPEERAWMDKFIENGFLDTFRHLNPDKIQYSWWTYMFKARERNIGWRIDYFLVSAKIVKQIKKAFILDEIRGSDHAPVGIIFNI